MAFEEGMPPLVTTACDVAMVELSTTVDEWVVWAGGGSPQGDLIDAILSRRTTSQTNPVPWPAMGRGSRVVRKKRERWVAGFFRKRALSNDRDVLDPCNYTKFHHHPAHTAGTLFGDVRLASATDIRWALPFTRSAIGSSQILRPLPMSACDYYVDRRWALENAIRNYAPLIR